MKTGTGEENGFGAPTQGRLMRELRAQKTGDLGVPGRAPTHITVVHEIVINEH